MLHRRAICKDYRPVRRSRHECAARLHRAGRDRAGRSVHVLVIVIRRHVRMNQAAAAVDERRQWDRLMAMAQLGAIPGDGVNRACLTELDRQARRLLIAWAKEIGAAVSVDAAANLWLRREGTDPRAAPVVTGSHMDTQPNGGRFDGIYGVIAGLEALTALHRSGVTLRRPVEVVAWTNEEGGRFAPGCMGSMSWSGYRRIEDFADVRRSRRCAVRRRAGSATGCGGRPAASRPRRPTARLCRGAYRAGSAPGGGGAGYRRRHRHPGQPLVHRDADRRDRACRHHAAGAAARRGAGHAARDRCAECADARSRRCAALHRRAHRGRAEHVEFGGEPRELHHRFPPSRQGRCCWRAAMRSPAWCRPRSATPA